MMSFTYDIVKLIEYETWIRTTSWEFEEKSSKASQLKVMLVGREVPNSHQWAIQIFL